MNSWVPQDIKDGNYQVTVNPDNIADFVFPFVMYIKTFEPEYVIVSDRGARPLGLATFVMYKRMFGKFPTFDNTIKFRRISKNVDYENTKTHLKPLLEKALDNFENPRILFLDDIVISGATLDITKSICKEISSEYTNQNVRGIKPEFGVLCSPTRVNVSTCKHTNAHIDVHWIDNPNYIGVHYSGTMPLIRTNTESLIYRKRILTSIDTFISTENWKDSI